MRWRATWGWFTGLLRVKGKSHEAVLPVYLAGKCTGADSYLPRSQEADIVIRLVSWRDSQLGQSIIRRIATG